MIQKYSYEKALNILTSQEKFHISLGLERVSKILKLLGNPQENLKIIHVAGTNGKGSTCTMLASILTEAGYKTGLFTSPHLIEYTERIKINGEDISRNDFAELIIKITELANNNKIPVTEFEILTVLAFEYFNKEKVDFVLLETGLGGRLDATNVIDSPVVSIITSIDIDHVDRLGDTVEKIAFEKSGIIKPFRPIITLKDNKGLNIIEQIASKNKSDLIIADSSSYQIDKNIIFTEDNSYELPLLGLWQLKNLSLVLKAVEFFNQNNIFISEQVLKSGLKKVKWPGRLQYIKEKSIVLDGAHNLSGAKLLKESLDIYFPDKKRIWIYSSLNTKDYDSIINVLFEKNDIVICTKSFSNSAVDPEKLKEKVLNNKLANKVYAVDNINNAINLSLSFLSNNFIIIIAGSLYTVGEALSIMK